MTPATYRHILKPLLPNDAFSSAPDKLVFSTFHLLVMLAGYVGIRYFGPGPMSIGCSFVIGHSLACIAFIAHDLSHNTIIRKRKPRYALELIFWGLTFISPTVWHRVHNHAHHSFTNTLDDPDRQFLTSEASALTYIYTRLFYPNHYSPWWNIFVGFHFIPYILRNTVAVFYPNTGKPSLVPAKPRYTLRQRFAVAFELIFIAMLQAVIFYIAGATWLRFLFASIIPVLFASSVVMAYIFTNHFLNPLCDTSDPLVSSTSIVVPRFIDRLHCNFSYHVEHHLFPNMNSDFYPEVSELLRSRFAEYDRIRFSVAWKRLWKNELFVSSHLPPCQ